MTLSASRYAGPSRAWDGLSPTAAARHSGAARDRGCGRGSRFFLLSEVLRRIALVGALRRLEQQANRFFQLGGARRIGCNAAPQRFRGPIQQLVHQQARSELQSLMRNSYAV